MTTTEFSLGTSKVKAFHYDRSTDDGFSLLIDYSSLDLDALSERREARHQKENQDGADPS